MHCSGYNYILCFCLLAICDIVLLSNWLHDIYFKSKTSNLYDPMSYLGITLASSSYKLFCSVLNNRLQQWADDNSVLTEEQNGFRKNRSCIDHLISLVNIVETRIRKKQNVFTAFIDFKKKAYDSIDRDLLWSKLSHIGLVKDSRFMRAVQGIYTNVECCVKINGKLTDWFKVSTGLRQGCLLSPLLFNLYINDLATILKETCTGISIAGENVCFLMYADDVILIAKN